MLKAVNDGYAIKLSWPEISEQSLSAALHEILYNSRLANHCVFIVNGLP